MRGGRLPALTLALVLVVGACGGDDGEQAGPVPDAVAVDGSTATVGGDGASDPDATATTAAPPSTRASTTASTVPPTTTTTAPPPPPEPMFRPGETSPEIGLLQLRLIELGYRPGEPNGAYGPQTTSAVMAFQKREGLGRDGVAGPKTLERLAAPQGAGPRRSGPGPWVEVDIARQVVFVADPGGAVFTLNTSTGSGQPYQSGGATAIARTPRGSYTVYRTVNALERGPLGTLYRPMYFTGGYALHGSPSVPGYPASHGCVRLSNADADWLWGFAGKGTPVDLYG